MGLISEIIGIVAGIVALLLAIGIVIFLVIFIKRKKRKQKTVPQQQSETSPEPVQNEQRGSSVSLLNIPQESKNNVPISSSQSPENQQTSGICTKTKQNESCYESRNQNKE